MLLEAVLLHRDREALAPQWAACSLARLRRLFFLLGHSACLFVLRLILRGSEKVVLFQPACVCVCLSVLLEGSRVFSFCLCCAFSLEGQCASPLCVCLFIILSIEFIIMSRLCAIPCACICN